jgi:hypothetical protein
VQPFALDSNPRWRDDAWVDDKRGNDERMERMNKLVSAGSIALCQRFLVLFSRSLAMFIASSLCTKLTLVCVRQTPL